VVVCAIGDVHGRLDLLEAATDELRRTARMATAEGKAFVAVFLGDYIDRGPDSQWVIAHLMSLQHEGLGEVIFLRGNHEQVMLDLADGIDDTLPWLDYGGLETLQSYGVDHPPAAHGPAGAGELGRAVMRAVPASHLEFLRGTQLYAKCGDYLFVHAGLRPDRLMDEQSAADMLWFRYYADEPPVHGEFVVHGHSTNERPILGRWRIGIDTEAYATGDLTLLRLDGAEREFLRISAPAAGPVQVTPWSRIDTSYSRREPSARAAVAATPGSPRNGRRRFGSLIVVALIMAAIAAVSVVVVARKANLGASPSPVAARVAPEAEPVVKAPSPAAPPQPALTDTGPTLRNPVDSTAPAPLPSVLPAAVAATPAAAQEPSAPGPRVQIGALDSPQAAQRAWDGMAQRFPELMKAKALKVETVQAGGKTYYRAFVTGFAAADQARDFCRKVGAADLACIVR
jgi:serine/threonine protein phosphatase 1